MGVRRESVELSLNDAGFSTGVAKAAAATALLNHELGNLDGNSVRANRSTAMLGDGNGGIAKTGAAARKSSADIDKYSGRLGLLTKTVLALGPAMVPISVAAIPAVTGLAAGFGAAAGAAGVALLAFNGVGDAVKAMDAYALQPTAANLQKMQQAMQDLGPAGANFARFIDGLEPQLRALQGSAREGLLPGVQEGIEELLPLLPKVEDFIGRIGSEMGNLAAEAGRGLTGDAGVQKFAQYIDTEGVPIMDAFARSTGKVASGLAALAADMAPLAADFAGGMEHAADSFQNWAEGLDQTQGFREFITYVEQEGPQVVDLLKTVASTALSIAEAFAPIGSATLPALTAVAKVIGLIASSPLGPVVATVISLNAAIGLGTLAVDKLAASWGRVAVAAGGAAEAEAAAATAGGGGLLAGLTGKLGTAAGAAVTIGAGAWGASALMSRLTHAQVDPAKGITSSAANKLAGNIDLTTSPRGYLGPISNVGAWVQDRLPGKDAYQVAQSNVSDTDLMLSQMARSGQGDQAAAAFAKISAAAKESGVSVERVAKAFPHYTAAVKDAGAASKSGADSTTKLTSSTQSLSEQFHEGTISLSQYRAGLAALHSQALTDFDAVTQFGSAVQTAAKQAKDGARAGLNPFTQAGNANRVAISGMVAAWNAQPAAIQNNIGKYQQMKAKLVEFMTQMGASKAQIADFTRQINLPKKLVVTAETAQAQSALAHIIAMAQSVPRTLRTDYIVNQINSVSKPRVNMPGSADGSTVPKDGGPYEDRYPYLLAPGEEVISNRNGQADRFRPLLKAINAGRLADGGTAGPIRQIVQTTGDRTIDRSLDKLTVLLGKHMPEAADKAIKAIERSAKVQSHQNSIAAKVAAAQADRDKAAADAAKDHRDAVLADMASIQQSIAARYQSDVFGGVDSSSIAYQIDPVTGKYVDAAQSSKLQTQGVLAGLQKDIANAQASRAAANSVQAELKGSGLSADQISQAVLYMQQNASVGQMQALASDKSLATQYAQLYTQRQQVSNTTGKSAANMVDARALQIAQQQYDLDRQREARSEQRAKQAAQRQKQFDQRMTHIETSLDALAAKIGREINTASKGKK